MRIPKTSDSLGLIELKTGILAVMVSYSERIWIKILKGKKLRAG